MHRQPFSNARYRENAQLPETYPVIKNASKDFNGVRKRKERTGSQDLRVRHAKTTMAPSIQSCQQAVYANDRQLASDRPVAPVTDVNTWRKRSTKDGSCNFRKSSKGQKDSWDVTKVVKESYFARRYKSCKIRQSDLCVPQTH